MKENIGALILLSILFLILVGPEIKLLATALVRDLRDKKRRAKLKQARGPYFTLTGVALYCLEGGKHATKTFKRGDYGS